MLGLGEAHVDETTIAIPPGSALAFFTDGLTESTRDLEEGYRRLRAALANPRVRAAENPARASDGRRLVRARRWSARRRRRETRRLALPPGRARRRRESEGHPQRGLHRGRI